MTNNANYGGKLVVIKSKLTAIQAFDALGPLTRAALNDSPFLWSPIDIYENGHIGRGLSDRQLSQLIIQRNDTFMDRAEYEREQRIGVWAPGRKPRARAEPLTEPPKPSPKRGSKAWVEEASARTKGSKE